MKTFLTVAMLLLTIVPAYSQTDSSIIAEISKTSKSRSIAEARQLLLDKFIEQDFHRVKVIKDYLLSFDDDDYIALYPHEFWTLSYWTNEYDDILSSAKNFNRDSLRFTTKRVPPKEDYLTVKLLEKSKESEELITDRIKNANLTKEEKDFLILNLKSLIQKTNPEKTNQNELNNLSDDFLKNHPNSDYATFTKTFIAHKYTTTNNGGGYFFHGGKFIFTGNLNEYYKSPTIVGMSLDILKNNWIYQMNIDLAFNKTKKDMPVQGAVWPAGSKGIGGHIDLAVGRYALNTKKIGLAPFASIGVFGLDANDNSTKEHPELKDAGIKTKIAGSIGFMTDFKLSSKITEPTYFNYNSTERTTVLRLTYSYLASPLKNKFIDYSGSVHKLTLGIGILNKNRKRVY